jgi:hypothetical protein
MRTQGARRAALTSQESRKVPLQSRVLTLRQDITGSQRPKDVHYLGTDQAQVVRGTRSVMQALRQGPDLRRNGDQETKPNG